MDTIIELVRHAKARTRDSWWGRPDQERPLVDTGVAQAERLLVDLAEVGSLSAVYTSPWTRCVQTVEPLAASLGLAVTEEVRLGEVATLPVHDDGDAWVTSAWLGGRAVAFLDHAAAEHAGGRIVACSHGDVIPAALALMAGRDGLDIADVSCRKAGRFTLTFNDGACRAVDYHPPPG